MKSLKRKFIVVIAMFIVAIMTAPVFAEQKIPRRAFIIQSVQENLKGGDRGCWDVPGSPFFPKKKQNLQLWKLGKSRGKWDRTYKFYRKSNGNYEIRANHRIKVSVDVSGSRYTPGNNIILYRSKGKSNQQFKMKHLGGGRWKIYTVYNNMVICADRKKTSNGGNLVIYKDHNGAWTEWILLDKKTGRPFIPATRTIIGHSN